MTTDRPIADDQAGIDQQVRMLYLQHGKTVLHRETMTFGTVAEVFAEGCWSNGKGEYLDPKQPMGEVEGWKMMRSPIVVFDDGNAFIIKPNACEKVTPEVAMMHTHLRHAVRLMMTGFGVTCRSAGLTSEASIAVARAVLVSQLRLFDAHAAGDHVG